MTSPRSRASADGILLPMQDASYDQLAPSRGASPRGASLQSSSAPGTNATAELQLSLVQQQLQQSQREVKKLKEEVYDSSSRLITVTTQLNEQKVEFSSLSNRYSATMEKLTSVEADARKLEEQLVQERGRVQGIREERDRSRVELREASWEIARLQKIVSEADANRGIDQRQVQRILSDRTQYIPASEVQRLEADAKDTQRALVNRLTAALDTLLASKEESETSLFVVRSAVLSAATDLETRVLRAEAALDDVHAQLTQYSDATEQESNDFLVALMSENKELWQHLTKLQSEHDLLEAELDLKTRRGDVVPRDEHEHAVRQVELLTDRMSKAQKIVEAQTQLAREHEAEMHGLMKENDRLRDELALLNNAHKSASDTSEKQSAALKEANKALHEATEKIEQLEEEMAHKQRQQEEVTQQLRATRDDLQEQYEARLADAQSDRAATEEALHHARSDFAATQEKLHDTEVKLKNVQDEYTRFRADANDTIQRLEQQQSTDLQGVRALMEEEMASLRAQLEEANAEARAAVRQRDEKDAASRSLTIEKKALVKDLDEANQALAACKQDLEKSVRRCQELEEAVEQQRAMSGEDGAQTQALKQTLARLEQEKEELEGRLVADQERSQQRYQQLQRDWQQSEMARTSLQDEVKALRLRLAELEAGRHGGERAGQEREQLMKENLRLHEQYQKVQSENSALMEDRKALRAQLHDKAEVTAHLDDLQRRLRELPQLRVAADEARRDALKAKEETNQLRQERDAMAARLNKFLEESKAASQMDDDFNRIFRDASDTVKRLGDQVSERHQNQNSSSANKSGGVSTAAGGDRYRVFSNTNPKPHTPYGDTPGRVSGGNSPREPARQPSSSAAPFTGPRPWKA